MLGISQAWKKAATCPDVTRWLSESPMSQWLSITANWAKRLGWGSWFTACMVSGIKLAVRMSRLCQAPSWHTFRAYSPLAATGGPLPRRDTKVNIVTAVTYSVARTSNNSTGHSESLRRDGALRKWLGVKLEPESHFLMASRPGPSVTARRCQRNQDIYMGLWCHVMWCFLIRDSD